MPNATIAETFRSASGEELIRAPFDSRGPFGALQQNLWVEKLTNRAAQFFRPPGVSQVPGADKKVARRRGKSCKSQNSHLAGKINFACYGPPGAQAEPASENQLIAGQKRLWWFFFGEQGREWCDRFNGAKSESKEATFSKRGGTQCWCYQGSQASGF